MKSIPTLVASLCVVAVQAQAGLSTDALGLQPDGTLYFLAAPGSANAVTVSRQNGRVILTDQGAPLPPCQPIPGLIRVGPHTLTLPESQVHRITVDLGDGDDTFEAPGFSLPVVVHGGPGNDRLNGGNASDTLTGDAGDDELHGNDGDDPLDGGDGRDTIAGGTGSDLVTGDGGADVLLGGAGTDDLHGDAEDFGLHGNDGDDTITILQPAPLCGGADDDQATLPATSGGSGFDTVILVTPPVSPKKESLIRDTLARYGVEVLRLPVN